jgi:hypothetical protein
VIQLTGKEYGVNWNNPAARRTMLPKLLLQYQGKKYRNVDRQQDIVVGRVGIKKVLSHLPDAKPAMLLAKLPEVLASMAWDHDEEPRSRDRNTRRWLHFTIDVSLAGVAHEARIKIREDANGQWFYDQRVRLAKKEGPACKPVASPKGPAGQAAGPSSTIIDPEAGKVKPEARTARRDGGPADA